LASLPPLNSSFRVQPLNGADRPALLAGYELLHEVAVGEFCTVHRARSLALASAPDVAVKRLRSSYRDAYGRARLMREARVGLTLHAPNLVRVLEVHDEPEPFMVMEYVPGASLRALLAHADGLEAPLIAPILVDVLRALSALHGYCDEEGAARPLVHQAPSARHMLVGADGVTRLIDLASVHQRGLGSTENVGRRFLHGELAPEQLLPRPRLDARCDIFIVGKALERALERACAAGEAQLRARCQQLFAIAARACAEAPGERFASADEMAEQLDDAAAQAELFAPRAQLVTRVRRMPGVELALAARHRPAPRARPSSPRVPALEPALVAPSPAPTVLAAHAALSAAPAAAVASPSPSCSHADPRASTAAPAPLPPPVDVPPPPTLGVPLAASAPALFAAPRDSGVSADSLASSFSAAAGGRNSMRSVVVVAGSVALLTSLLTLGVRGLQHAPPSASAARLALDSPAPSQRTEVHEPRAVGPVVTPLAPSPRRRAALRDQVAPRAPKPPEAWPSETGAARDETFGHSSAASIAASIRETETRRPRAVARPRLLRVELPENPY
jgi:hypothetical protein